MRQRPTSVLPYLQRIDWVLVLAIIPLLLAGWVTMTSFVGDNYFASRQVIWIVVSFIVMFAASMVDWSFLRRTGPVVVIYGVGVALLASLLAFATVTKGVQSWIHLGPVSFQPADLMKIILIVTLAKYFTRRHVEISQYRHIVVSGLYALVPLLLIFMQPDLGSALIIFAVWLGMIVVSGVSKKHLAILAILAATTASLLWLFALAPYQKARVMTFLHPLEDIRGSGYNAFQSTIAVGSGGVTGKGVGFGTQSRLEFLPEYETDFIFAAYAEEWGFIGALIMFALFAIIVWRLLVYSLRGATNFEVLFGVGLAIMLISHFVINVGMNIGLLPVTGITLPFVSYGGSHLLVSFLGLGMFFGMRRYERPVERARANYEFLGLGDE